MSAALRRQSLAAPALHYWTRVFGAGFVLGAIRVPFLVPRLGVRMAELIEMPVMGVVIVLAARSVLRRYRPGRDTADWWRIGALALGLLVVAELLLSVVMAGRNVAEYLASRDPVSGSAYLVMLGVFAAMPAWLSTRRVGDE